MQISRHYLSDDFKTFFFYLSRCWAVVQPTANPLALQISRHNHNLSDDFDSFNQPFFRTKSVTLPVSQMLTSVPALRVVSTGRVLTWSADSSVAVWRATPAQPVKQVNQEFCGPLFWLWIIALCGGLVSRCRTKRYLILPNCQGEKKNITTKEKDRHSSGQAFASTGGA